MIKFFRNIRKTLIEENKSVIKNTNYIKYALGEIVLLVFGILIALQVNNWNERKKAIQAEEELISSLEDEINDNITQFEYINTRNEDFKYAYNELISKLDKGIDSFSLKEISNTFNYYLATIHSPILDVIVASNSDVLIKKKELMADFRSLKNNYTEVESQEYYLNEFWNSKVTDFFISCGFSIDSYIEKDIIISIKDIELGGYSKKQFISLIKFKKELENYWEGRREIALKKSREVFEILKKSSN